MRLSETSRVGGTGMLALMATYGIGRQAYGLFVPSFREEFGLSVETVGLYASAAQAGYLVATIAAGVLTARYGPRLPIVSGCLLLVAAAVATAVAPGPLPLAIGIVLAGISAGGTWGPFSDAVDRKVPPEGRRRALALINDGSPAGIVVASALVLAFGDRWRGAWWAFALVGVVAAVAAWRTLPTSGGERAARRVMPQWRWFVNARSVRLFAVTVAAAVPSGAYFAYAPETVRQAGLHPATGPVMWAVLGITGALVGAFGGGMTTRYGLRRPLAAMLLLLTGANVVLVVAPSWHIGALTSAALFGVGFTSVFAILVIWSQQVFDDQPTTGFTVTIVVSAVGMIAGPALFGLLVGRLGHGAALSAMAVPPLVATLIPPRPEDRS